MLTHEELLEIHDKNYEHNQIVRERAADDSVFYWVTQWDDELITTLQYQGEFNILRKAGRQIAADLASHPVQVDFEPNDESREDESELLDGLYRTDDRVNTSIEAYENASGEAIVCGVGGWYLEPEYATDLVGNDNQRIVRRPLYEANNNSFPDANAKLLDKSDAMNWSILEAYSEAGYKRLVHELTGEEMDKIDPSSFKHPERSYVFPWIQGSNDVIYVGKIYHREKLPATVIKLSDPFGQTIQVYESDINDQMDTLKSAGYEIVATRKIKRWQVTLYIVSGQDILKSYVIPCKYIPVVHVYGERAIVEDMEYYEGVTRLAKDPQRLRNFIGSYLADIASRSPRSKPMFTPEQIGKYKFMYDEAGIDNNYPYVLQESKDGQGNELPLGPLGHLPNAEIPPTLLPLMDLTRQAVEDVANPGVPQDIADTDLSGKAVAALQNRLDQQSIVYQEHMKHAKRRDGEIYASMASRVYDSPRKVTLTKPDGTRQRADLMEFQMGDDGEPRVINDLTNLEFNVYSDISPTYATLKEQTMDHLQRMADSVAATDPGMHKLIMLKQQTMIDGPNLDDMRDYARRQLILMGVIEPESEEEMQMMQEAQQDQPQDPNQMIVEAQLKIEQDKVLMEAERLKFEREKAAFEQQNKEREAGLKEAEFVSKREDNAHEKAIKEMEVSIKAKSNADTLEQARIDAQKEITVATIQAQATEKQCDTEREVKGKEHEKEPAPQIINIDATQPVNKTITIKPTKDGGMSGSISAGE